MNGFLILMMLEKLRLDKLVLFWVLFINFSCKQEMKDVAVRNTYIQSHFVGYKEIYKSINDSILLWIDLKLSVMTYEINNSYYQIDSCIIFNKNENLFITSFNKRDVVYNTAVYDYIKDLGGAKIDGKWYFFFMNVSEPVVRSYWQDSVYVPLTFEELSYVAYERRFKAMVANVLSGNADANEAYFQRIFSELQVCKDYPAELKIHCRDSVIISSTKLKYQFKLSQKEISEIEEAIKTSKIPADKPLVEKRSWWDKMWYGEKIFESDEWKDYIKNKAIH